MTTELARRDTATNAGDYALVARDTTDEKLVLSWLHSGRRANSAATQDSYGRTARAFLAFVGKPLQSLTLSDLQAWQASLSGSAATQRTKIGTVRSLFVYAQKIGYIRFNPAVMIEPPYVAEALHRRVLSEANIVRLRDACQTPREKALIYTLYDSGARISELLALTWQDVQPREAGKGAVLHIVCGKGRKEREAGIRQDAYAALRSIRPETATAEDFVFATRSGRHVDRHAAHKLFKAVAARAGLKDVTAEDVSCHWLRHSHASHAQKNGATPVETQAQLGHASLATTTRYSHADTFSSDKLAF